MSSSNYTRVENTVVSGSSLLSSLSGADVKALNFQAKLDRTPVVTVAAADVTLSVDDLVQATLDTQLVDGSGLTGSKNLVVDLNAAGLVSLFNLSSGSDYRKVLNFQVATKTNANNTLSLKSTGTKVYVTGDNASSSTTSSTLFIGNQESGTRSTVELWATNVTSGSESVLFNVVLNGN